MKIEKSPLNWLAVAAATALLSSGNAQAGPGQFGQHRHGDGVLPDHLVEFDLDGDGVLDADEIAAARAARDAARAAKLAEIDTDGDGAISREELDAYRAAQAQARFDEADTDASGDISLEELAASTGLALDSPWLARIFAHLAGDDGLIAADEFGARRGHRARWGFLGGFRGHFGHHRGHGGAGAGDDAGAGL